MQVNHKWWYGDLAQIAALWGNAICLDICPSRSAFLRIALAAGSTPSEASWKQAMLPGRPSQLTSVVYVTGEVASRDDTRVRVC